MMIIPNIWEHNPVMFQENHQPYLTILTHPIQRNHGRGHRGHRGRLPTLSVQPAVDPLHGPPQARTGEGGPTVG